MAGDPFSAHGYMSGDIASWLTASGNYVMAGNFILASGDRWFYPYTGIISPLAAAADGNLIRSYFPWPTIGYGEGIFWNEVGRPAVVGKMNYADWVAYLAAN